MNLTKTRESVAALTDNALSGRGDVAVVDHIPDQVSVPAVLVAWGTPALEPDTVCGDFLARFDLILLAGRFEPGGAFDTLEALVSLIVPDVMASDGFVFENLREPYPLELAGVVYLAQRLTLTINTEG